MQNRYSGDIGDFSKLSLLRSLFECPKYRIGLVWYLYPDEDHNRDGRHIDYLEHLEYKQCDSDLVGQLSSVIKKGRSVKSLQQAELLPKGTKYYSEPVDFFLNNPGQTALNKQHRKDSREQWLKEAVSTIDDCNVVVLDPDNGLQIKSVPNITQKKSGKYAFYYEVDAFFEDKTICVIYHHFDRSASHEIQMKLTAKKLKDHIDFNGSVFALRFFPYSPRAYFLLVVQEEVISIRNKLFEYLDSSCGFGWDSFYEI